MTISVALDSWLFDLRFTSLDSVHTWLAVTTVLIKRTQKHTWAIKGIILDIYPYTCTSYYVIHAFPYVPFPIIILLDITRTLSYMLLVPYINNSYLGVLLLVPYIFMLLLPYCYTFNVPDKKCSYLIYKYTLTLSNVTNILS